MQNEYKSIEQRIFDYFNNKGVVGFCRFFGKSLYSTFVSGFRIPTLIRKVGNNQLWTDDIDGGSDFFGAIGGLFGAVGLDAYGIVRIVNEARHDNYVPLIATGGVFLATNLASFAFEIGRLSKNREERDFSSTSTTEEKVRTLDKKLFDIKQR